MAEKTKKRKRDEEEAEKDKEEDSTEGMEDLRSEKDIEAGEEEPSEEDDATLSIPTDINNISRLDKLFAILEQYPNEARVLSFARATIRKFYMSQGGATINSTDPIPVNLDIMSAKDLSNVLQNMILEQVKTKRNRITEQVLNLFSNVTYLGSVALGNPISRGVVDQGLGGDHILRDAFVETFLGSSGKFSSFATLIVGSLNHATNFLVHHVEDRAAKRRRTAEAYTQAQAGPGVPPGTSTPFDGRPATSKTTPPPPAPTSNSSSSSSSNSSSQPMATARP
jgi:hypothetical protein